MLHVTFVIKRTASGGYVAEWEDPQTEDGIRMEADTLAEVRERAGDALGNWIASRGGAIQVVGRFVEDFQQHQGPEFGA